MPFKAFHDFIFSPGVWIGEGFLTFKGSSEKIKFYTKWTIKVALLPEVSLTTTATMECCQQVELQGIPEQMTNYLTFSHLSESGFAVCLENQLFGKISGKGIQDNVMIAWEFHDQPPCDGFETYTLQPNGDYFFKAEYSTPGQHRTYIEGRLWKKGEIQGNN